MSFTSWKEFKKSGTVEWANDSVEIPEDIIQLPINRLNESNEEELLSIKGIGPKTVEKLLSQLPVTSLDELNVSKTALKALRCWISR